MKGADPTVKGAGTVRSRRRNTDAAAPEAVRRPASATAAGQRSTPDRGPAEGAPAGNRALTGAGSQASGRALPGAASGQLASHAGSASSSSRFPLKNWRVRSRLLLLIAVPTLAAVILGGLSVSSSIRSALVYQRVQRLASLADDVTGLVQALQNEREDTVTFITMANQGGRGSAQSTNAGDRATAVPERGLVRADQSVTNQSASQVRTLAATIGSSYPALAQQEAQGAITAIDDLTALRHASIDNQLPALTVIDDYGNTITQLLTLENEIAVAGSNDAVLAGDVRLLSLISSMKEEAAQQQAIVTSALGPDLIGVSPLGAESITELNDQAAEQAANLSAFNLAGTAAQRKLYNSVLSSPLAAEAQQQVQQATSLLESGTTSATDPTVAVAASDASFTVSSLRSVEQGLMSSVVARSKSLRGSAIKSVIVESLAVLLVLALAMVFTTLVARSLVRPLRRLRTGALEVAGVHLPETVRRMSETDGEGVSLDVEPIDVDSSDEIGEVARAFDQVHREALRLAATEAALRGNVNAMFVNLSRRSQSLVERQIQLIDELEQGEQDSERLSSLFRMDHLATRMRRNSENLLVLAGHDASRHWNQPVAVVDVLRAAVSEIEQYERITLNVQPGIAVRGQAVSDVVHLTAELVENATAFSASETPVSIVGHLLSSGGVLLEIADQGVGMGAEELAHANWRLDNPPEVDVAVSRRMGLFVVARLAARHGIRVRLRLGASGGLTALVWLPDEAVTHEGVGGAPGLAGFDANVNSGVSNGGARSGEWWDTDRSAAEQEVNAARAPRFAPLADAGDTSLGPRRVPGAGLRPGAGRVAATATGPLPAFRTTPQPSSRPDAQPFTTSPVPVAGGELGTAPKPVFGTGPESIWNVGPEPAADMGAESFAGFEPSHGEVGGVGASPQSLISAEQVGSGPGPVVESGEKVGPARPVGSGRRPVPGAPSIQADGLGASAVGLGPPDWTPGSSGGGVVVPPPASLAGENRLPIFEAVESDWFRRGRHAVSLPGREERLEARNPDSNGWSSAADEGWRAAEAASAPSSGGVTPAGLPKRVPQANLVPGTAAEAPAPVAPRSAAVTRERFASLQRGIRQGRAAVSGEEAEGGEDDSSSDA
jgi:signal transduction histidine kinase